MGKFVRGLPRGEKKKVIEGGHSTLGKKEKKNVPNDELEGRRGFADGDQKTLGR